MGINIKLLCSCVQEVGTKTENYNDGVTTTNRISDWPNPLMKTWQMPKPNWLNTMHIRPTDWYRNYS